MFSLFHTLVIAIASFLFGVHSQAVPVPQPTPSPIAVVSPTPFFKLPAPTIANPTDQLENCPINGQMVQLTFSECQKRLNLEINKEKAQIQQAPQQLQNMYKEYYSDEAKIWAQMLTPTITPINVQPALQQSQQQQDTMFIDEMKTFEQDGASTCATIKQNYTMEVGQQASNAAANGMDSTSGVEQSQLASLKQQTQNSLQQEVTNVTGQINYVADESGLTDQANQIIQELQQACSL